MARTHRTSGHHQAKLAPSSDCRSSSPQLQAPPTSTCQPAVPAITAEEAPAPLSPQGTTQPGCTQGAPRSHALPSHSQRTKSRPSSSHSSRWHHPHGSLKPSLFLITLIAAALAPVVRASITPPNFFCTNTSPALGGAVCPLCQVGNACNVSVCACVIRGPPTCTLTPTLQFLKLPLSVHAPPAAQVQNSPPI